MLHVAVLIGELSRYLSWCPSGEFKVLSANRAQFSNPRHTTTNSPYQKYHCQQPKLQHAENEESKRIDDITYESSNLGKPEILAENYGVPKSHLRTLMEQNEIKKKKSFLVLLFYIFTAVFRCVRNSLCKPKRN